MSNIHDAARFGDLKGLGQLLAEGANPDQRDEGGMTPLHYAASAGHSEVGKLLLENGAILDFRDAEGATPLYFAAYFGRTEMAAFLLDRGADPNACNQANYTPLHMAAERGHLPVVEALLGHGGDPNFAARNGDTPLSGAETNGHPDIVSLLRENLSQQDGAVGSHAPASAGTPPASSPAPLQTPGKYTPGLVGKVIDTFKVMPFVSVRVICFYSSQDLYQMQIDIEAEKSAQRLPRGLQVFCIEGSYMEVKRVEMEKALQLIRTLPNKGCDSGMPSYLVLITDSDGSFATQVASLPLASNYALFFGYKPEVDGRIRQKLSGRSK
jgi:hypothetical protein